MKEKVRLSVVILRGSSFNALSVEKKDKISRFCILALSMSTP